MRHRLTTTLGTIASPQALIRYTLNGIETPARVLTVHPSGSVTVVTRDVRTVRLTLPASTPAYRTTA